MKYQVNILPAAARQLHDAARWWAENRSVEQAARWFTGFEMALANLSEHPARHAFARENDAFPFELRQMLYGSGSRYTHRAIFEIQGNKVIVYAVRHLAQAVINPEYIIAHRLEDKPV